MVGYRYYVKDESYQMRFFGRQRKTEASAVEISEKDGVRYLHLGGPAIQSAMRMRDPYSLELEYTRAMMMFALFHPSPRDICLIGLGGGSIAKYIHRNLVDSRLDAVEVSAEVVSVARGYFHLPEDDGRLTVRVGDGAARVREVMASWDILLVDGYDANRIIEDLASETFYQACRTALRPNGVAVFNLWGSDRFFDTYLGRIKTAFDSSVLTLPAEQKGNIQVFAFADSAAIPPFERLVERAKDCDKRLGLGFARFLDRMRALNPGSSTGFTFR
jgi:spermidine synthase